MFVSLNYLPMLEMLRQFVSGYIPLTNEEFAFLADRIVLRKFERREFLLKAGETERYMNFIVKGLARMYFEKGQTEVITHIAREGELISSTASFLSGAPSFYHIETLEPCTFLSLTHDQLEEVYRGNSRIERMGRLMTTQFLLQKEEWELECIRLDTRERFLHFVEKNPDLLQRVPQKYLASYLNMKPETFSRLKHLLKKKPGSGRPN